VTAGCLCQTAANNSGNTIITYQLTFPVNTNKYGKVLSVERQWQQSIDEIM